MNRNDLVVHLLKENLPVSEFQKILREHKIEELSVNAQEFIGHATDGVKGYLSLADGDVVTDGFLRLILERVSALLFVQSTVADPLRAATSWLSDVLLAYQRV